MSLRHYALNIDGDYAWTADYDTDVLGECARCLVPHDYYLLYNGGNAEFAHERNATETGYVCGACLEILLALAYIDSSEYASISSDPVYS